MASAITAHARTACHGKAASSATHASKPCLMFGASVAMRHTNGRGAHAQSGCLSFGSLLANQQRQSATCNRQVAGRPAAASDQAGALIRSTNRQHAARTHRQHASGKTAVSTMVYRPRPKSLETLQNAGSSIQGGVCMQGRSINIHGLENLLSRSVPPLGSLTGRCSRRPFTGSLRQRLMGAAELGR